MAFAKITFKKPHLILLDEPSNHLVSTMPDMRSFHFQLISSSGLLIHHVNCLFLQDLDAVEALIQGLVLFQGGVLMVSRYGILYHSNSWDSISLIHCGKNYALFT